MESILGLSFCPSFDNMQDLIFAEDVDLMRQVNWGASQFASRPKLHQVIKGPLKVLIRCIGVQHKT